MKNRERFYELLRLQDAAKIVLAFSIAELGALDAREHLDPDTEQQPEVLPTKPGAKDTTIEELELTARGYNVLKVLDVKTAGELAAWDVASLTRVRNVGPKTLGEYREVLGKLGLAFRVDDALPQPPRIPERHPPGTCKKCGAAGTRNKAGFFVVTDCPRFRGTLCTI